MAFEAKDYKNDQYVRWCPGCGDYAVLSAMHRTMADLGLNPNDVAVISGIGCSSRLTYYMNTYGFHTIHGRATAVATGVKVANPKLSVWQVTGDGDCLAIGGNHFIHAIRRNVDLNILLLNNKIYGMTKGQYSPTSERGYISKSSPFGTIEDPFIPAELVLGARGNFFARALDVDMSLLQEVMKSSALHKGTSVVEILQNCVIFTNGIHSYYSDKESRLEHTIHLKQGEKMLFGKENEKGLYLDGFELKVGVVGKDIPLESVLVHDATCKDNTLHMKLSMMQGPDMPLALGVIRSVDAPTYEQCLEEQIKEVQSKTPIRTLRDFLYSRETWEIH